MTEDVEVEVARLELDEEFFQDQGSFPQGAPPKWVWGRLLDRGVGSVLVETVEDGKVVKVRWAPEALVIPNRDIPVPDIESEDIQPMATTTPNPVAVNLVTRYKFQLKQKSEGSDEAKATADQRIPLLIKEAATKGVVLPHPMELGFPFDDDVFDTLLDSPGPASDATPTNGAESSTKDSDMTEAATAPTLTKADKLKQANAARQAKLAEAKEAKAATKAAKKSAAPKREKVVIEPHECLDGCGEVLTTNAKFKPGHDAKLKSIIVKIERGELELDSLPGIASDVTKFKKGDLLKSKDEKGKVTSTKQLYICTESPVKLPAH